MSIFGTSFNARYSSPEEIAETFIAPPGFDDIVDFSNMILVGPRGIGKTTVLKLLTPLGLSRYSSLYPERAPKVDYLPVYIPAEKTWKGNAEAIRHAGQSEEIQEKILNGLFVSHCLYCVISSVQDCRRVGELHNAERQPPSWTLKITAESEAVICRHLSELWELEKIQNSFIGVKISLLKRTNQFCTVVNSLSKPGESSQIDELPELEILQMFRGLFDIFEEVLGVNRWSLNFDEMEIAPHGLIRSLFENLRSFDQRAVLKFSLFPYVEFYDLIAGQQYDADSPVAGSDFRSINLASRFTNTGSDFALELIRSICRKRDVEFEEIRAYLNSSTAIRPDTRKFGGGRFQRNFEGIYAYGVRENIDGSFYEYLADKGINSVEDVARLGGNHRAEKIRKPFPIAEIRQYYLRDKLSVENGILRRSIKGYGYYHGFDQIVSLTEDNPRAIYFYFNELIDQFKNGVASSTAQNKCIRTNVDRFRAFVATQAVPRISSGSKLRNTLNVVDRIGTDLSLYIFDDKFHAEPPLSFKFNRLDQITTAIIGIAINTGAIVPEQQTEDSHLIFDLPDCRMRVSHRLAPFYPLPTITGNHKVYSKIPSLKGGEILQPDLLSYRDEDD